jgi:hypothetical protein
VSRAVLLVLGRVNESEIGLAAGLAPGFFDEPMPTFAAASQERSQLSHLKSV